ncbi:MAG: aminopeptidase P family protein [Bacteroidia bacterium]|nr:aminopeptidase P family protein [Bacteroidia bacterium]
MKNLQFFLLLFFLIPISQAQNPLDQILDEQERAALIDEILQERMENLLPQLMEKAGIDMWIVISREYNEDPVMKTMLPATWLSARRRTIMVFYNGNKGLEKIAIARYSVGKLLKGQWNLNVYPDQWEALVQIIKEKNPEQIGLNYSRYFALADGLVKTEFEEFQEKLPEEYQKKVVSAEKLAISWLETRSEKEKKIYPLVCAMGHQILQEAFSEAVITPGKTTSDDVVWWLRDRVTKLGLDTWFHPSVSIQRASMGDNAFLRSFSKRPEDDIIQYGDLLHVDFGITYLRLNSDQQQHFYVLKPDEDDIPKGLKEAFVKGNRLQDILLSEFKQGKSGNQILLDALEQAKKEGIQASIYTHPIGFHGHAAGPTIGMWDKQQGVKGNGDYPLFANTAYSIELYAASKVPEWNKSIRIMLEENGLFDGESFEFLDGRATQIFPIPRK